MAETEAKVKALRDMLSSMKESATSSGGSGGSSSSSNRHSSSSSSHMSAQDAMNNINNGTIKQNTSAYYEALNAMNRANGLAEGVSPDSLSNKPIETNFNPHNAGFSTSMGYGSAITNAFDNSSVGNNTSASNTFYKELDKINNAYNPDYTEKTPSGFTYGVDTAKSFYNTKDGQALKDKIISDVLSGKNISNYGDMTTNGIEKMIINNAQKPYGFNKDDFLKKYMEYMKTAIDNSKLSEQMLSKNKMEQELLAQSDEQRQADKNYTDQIDSINQGQYNSFENAKVRGMQRGVNYSAQQAGVESGIESRGITDKRKTQEVRDLKLSSIRDKINAIKSGNLNEIQSIEAKYNGKLQETMANAFMKSSDREFQINDNIVKHMYDMEDTLFKNNLTQSNMGKQQDLDLQKMSVNHGYDLEKMDTQNQYDQQKIQTMFDNDLKKMSVDQGYKKELQNMDYTFKKQFLKLETVEKKELMKFDTEQKKVIMALDNKYQKEILASQRSSSGYSSGGRYYPSSGKKHTSSQQAYSNTMDKASREMALSLVMNDPHVKVNRADVANDLVKYVGGDMTTKQFMGKYTSGSYDVPTMNKFLNNIFPNRINK